MTPASDVYSFAILMYEMFTRKHLFKGLLQSQVRLPFRMSWTPAVSGRPYHVEYHAHHPHLARRSITDYIMQSAACSFMLAVHTRASRRPFVTLHAHQLAFPVACQNSAICTFKS